MTHWTDVSDSGSSQYWRTLGQIGDPSGGIDFVATAGDRTWMISDNSRFALRLWDPSDITRSGATMERRP